MPVMRYEKTYSFLFLAADSSVKKGAVRPSPVNTTLLRRTAELI